MLRDSLHIQQEDARYLSRHAAAADRPPIEPLYGDEDVRGVVKLLEPLEPPPGTNCRPRCDCGSPTRGTSWAPR